MSTATEIFSVSGPSHLTIVDWTNPNHRRTVAASLVKGTYMYELDRQRNLIGSQAEATQYWEFFHFRQNQVLTDETDHSIFGAVYEYTFNNHNNSINTLKPPKYVIAFRGTLLKHDTKARDLALDFMCICNMIHNTSRVKAAIHTAMDLCSIAGPESVWLAGHSLGSAIGMLVGKNMAKLGVPLETYLFNPPYIEAPIQIIEEKRVRYGIRISRSIVKFGLSTVVNGIHHHLHLHLHHHHHHHRGQDDEEYDYDHHDEDSIARLSSWAPNLFLNHSDMICSGYIGYFETRRKLEEMGASWLERDTRMNSLDSLLVRAIGIESEPYDLLPSALVTVNMTPAPNFLEAHNLVQWWNPNFHYRSLAYQFSR